jgi:hypothetical protein
MSYEDRSKEATCQKWWAKGNIDALKETKVYKWI